MHVISTVLSRSWYLTPEEIGKTQTDGGTLRLDALSPPHGAPWAHFQLLVEHLADGVTVQDASGRLVYANEHGARLSGYDTPGELLNAPVGDFQNRFEVLDTSGLPVALERLPGRLALTNGHADAMLRVRDRRTGAERWSEVRAYVVRSSVDDTLFVVNLFRDVTELVEQQRLLEEQTQELEEQTAQAQSLAEELEQTNDELVRSLQDAEEARALAEDRAQWLARLHTLTMALSRALVPEQVTEIALAAGIDAFGARGAALWVYDDEMSSLRQIGSRGIGHLDSSHYEEIPLDAPLPQAESAHSGEVVVVESRSAPGSLTTPIRVGGRTIGVMTLAFDEPREFSVDHLRTARTIGKEVGMAMDRTRTRTQLDEARVAAEAASEAKSSFLATMSHELRTPINAILGFTDLLQLGIAGSKPALQTDYLNRIRRSTEHLLDLINDVLDLSKVESGTLAVAREAASAQSAVSDALALIRNAADERQIRLESSCGDGIMYRGDPLRVRQVLLNLLSNAIKFSERGSTVQLLCDVVGGHDRRVEFLVVDQGIGIAPDERDMIFDPFMQSERGYTRTHGGTGLGLSISRQLARLMGGDVTVTSHLGRGSTFVLSLPAEIDG